MLHSSISQQQAYTHHIFNLIKKNPWIMHLGWTSKLVSGWARQVDDRMTDRRKVQRCRTTLTGKTRKRGSCRRDACERLHKQKCVCSFSSWMSSVIRKKQPFHQSGSLTGSASAAAFAAGKAFRTTFKALKTVGGSLHKTHQKTPHLKDKKRFFLLNENNKVRRF